MPKHPISISGDLLDVPKAADESGLGVAIIRRYCETGRINAKKVGGSWVISRVAFDLFMTQERRRGRPTTRSEKADEQGSDLSSDLSPAVAQADDKIMLGLIAGGLREYRDRSLAPRRNKSDSWVEEFPHPKSLILGWDYLSMAFIRSGRVNEQPIGIDELYAWCARSLSQWPFGELFKNQTKFSEGDNLIDHDLIRADSVGLTALCEDWARSQFDYRSEVDEERIMPVIRDLCRSLTNGQKIYTQVRQFLIEHPVVAESDLEDFIQDLPGEIVTLLTADDGAYVPVPSSLANKNKIAFCPYCGSILDSLESAIPAGSDACLQKRCRDKRKQSLKNVSAKGEPRRLLNGMRRYVSEAGQSEMVLKKRLHNLGIQVELWPEFDAYDLLLTFPNNQKWAVDVKDWIDPIALGIHISRKEDRAISPSPRWDRAFFVFPDDLKTRRPAYATQFADECADALNAQGIQAMFMNDFIDECKKLNQGGRSS